MDSTKHIIESYGPNGRIALFFGWTFDNTSYATHPWNSPNGTAYRYPPDYAGNLNEMHEAEKRLSDSQLSAYVGELANVIVNGEDKTTLGNQMWHATAEQRAEAFLKTIGKWEDDSICFNSMFWKCKDEI